MTLLNRHFRYFFITTDIVKPLQYCSFVIYAVLPFVYDAPLHARAFDMFLSAFDATGVTGATGTTGAAGTAKPAAIRVGSGAEAVG